MNAARSGDGTKKVALERILQALEPVGELRPTEEPYATPAPIAAEVVYFAHGKGDIGQRSVVDLGCGSGVLAIAARLLGAARVVGVDVNRTALDIARRNAERADVEIEWRFADVRRVREAFDTVIMNPPFGSQRRHADRPFFASALACGRVVYTFLNAKAERFVRDQIVSAGGRVTDRLEYRFPISHTFAFHRDAVRDIDVVLYRFEVAKG